MLLTEHRQIKQEKALRCEMILMFLACCSSSKRQLEANIAILVGALFTSKRILLLMSLALSVYDSVASNFVIGKSNHRLNGTYGLQADSVEPRTFRNPRSDSLKATSSKG